MHAIIMKVVCNILYHGSKTSKLYSYMLVISTMILQALIKIFFPSLFALLFRGFFHNNLPVESQATWTTVTGKVLDRKSTRLNSSHANISYAVFCLKKKKKTKTNKNKNKKNNKKTNKKQKKKKKECTTTIYFSITEVRGNSTQR